MNVVEKENVKLYVSKDELKTFETREDRDEYNLNQCKDIINKLPIVNIKNDEDYQADWELHKFGFKISNEKEFEALFNVWNEKCCIDYDCKFTGPDWYFLRVDSEEYYYNDLDKRAARIVTLNDLKIGLEKQIKDLDDEKEKVLKIITSLSS